MNNQVLTKYRFPFTKLRKHLSAAAVLILVALIPAQVASAQNRERSGRDVVDAVCAACHQSGAKGAPKIGDEKAWPRLAARDLTDLAEKPLWGVREMPAHGGNMTLNDIEIERAVTYMVNRSGGKWNEPVSGLSPSVERRGGEVLQSRCAKYRQSGVAGAPKIGDRDAWLPRLKRGLDYLVRSAINGHGPMPPRGGMADLTDTEIRGAIVYMLYNPGQVPAQGAATALSATADRNHKIVSGTKIYLGIISAEAMRAQYSKGSPEYSMHDGIPIGKG